MIQSAWRRLTDCDAFNRMKKHMAGRSGSQELPPHFLVVSSSQRGSSSESPDIQAQHSNEHESQMASRPKYRAERGGAGCTTSKCLWELHMYHPDMIQAVKQHPHGAQLAERRGAGTFETQLCFHCSKSDFASLCISTEWNVSRGRGTAERSTI